jgi:hypothetical protein
MKEIIIARKCLQSKGFSCDNKECKNHFCPLNPYWDIKVKKVSKE